jgi:hypothetical protein
MGKMQRTKGQVGEREAAALISQHTGWNVTRRVRNAAGDSDLVGVPGWSLEIKRHASGTRSDIACWWKQCVSQAGVEKPVLLYRFNHGEWRAVWQLSRQWITYEWTVEGSVAAWAFVAREDGS